MSGLFDWGWNGKHGGVGFVLLSGILLIWGRVFFETSPFDRGYRDNVANLSDAVNTCARMLPLNSLVTWHLRHARCSLSSLYATRCCSHLLSPVAFTRCQLRRSLGQSHYSVCQPPTLSRKYSCIHGQVMPGRWWQDKNPWRIYQFHNANFVACIDWLSTA